MNSQPQTEPLQMDPRTSFNPKLSKWLKAEGNHREEKEDVAPGEWDKPQKMQTCQGRLPVVC